MICICFKKQYKHTEHLPKDKTNKLFISWVILTWISVTLIEVCEDGVRKIVSGAWGGWGGLWCFRNCEHTVKLSIVACGWGGLWCFESRERIVKDPTWASWRNNKNKQLQTNKKGKRRKVERQCFVMNKLITALQF